MGHSRRFWHSHEMSAPRLISEGLSSGFARLPIFQGMLRKMISRVPGIIGPCQPSRVARPPSGPLWVHEIKHDGYRLMVRKDGSSIRCFTRNGA